MQNYKFLKGKIQLDLVKYRRVSVWANAQISLKYVTQTRPLGSQTSDRLTMSGVH